jgi:hypothetical protein
MTCAHCGAEFTPAFRGRPQIYCVTECRRAAQNVRRGHAAPGARRGARPARARPDPPPRATPRPTPRRRRRAQVGTQNWMTDHSVACCSAEFCWWDAAACPTHGRKRIGQESERA